MRWLYKYPSKDGSCKESLDEHTSFYLSGIFVNESTKSFIGTSQKHLYGKASLSHNKKKNWTLEFIQS